MVSAVLDLLLKMDVLEDDVKVELFRGYWWVRRYPRIEVETVEQRGGS
jgi:hypothetical protein